MKCALLGLLMLMPMLAWGQMAGRVLLAVGDVSVLRGTATLPLALNSLVFPGDTIRLGPSSNAQIRLTDESIVGLRERSAFRIDEYQYARGDDTNNKGVFSLLAGGMRTVTGQLGRLAGQRGNYAVRTPTSTIGIRGTHYTVVHCDNDCGSASTASALLASASLTTSDVGPLAQVSGGAGGVPNGTYGGVTDGRISTTPNDAPQFAREFGQNEYFHVATASSQPQSLIAPPGFLHDRLSGQNRTRGQGGNESGDTLAQGGINAESRPGGVPEGPRPSDFIVTEQKTSTGESTVAASIPADTGFLAYWSRPGSFDDFQSGGALIPLSALTLGAGGAPSAFQVPANCAGPAGDGCAQPPSGSLGAPVEFSSATFPDSTQVVHWGRWDSGTINDNPAFALSNTTQAHVMYAPLTPAETIASKTGMLMLQSSLPGLGTSPTNNFGAVAVGGVLPSIAIDFTARTASVSPATISFPAVGAEGTSTWTLAPGAGSLIIAAGSGAYFMVESTGGSCASSATACNGGTGFAARARAAGIFIGPAGDHAGVSLTGVAGTSSFGTVRVYCPTC